MFKKKKCNRCGNKLSDSYDFCPYCGNNLRNNLDEEDWGILGKNDLMPSVDEIKLPFGFNTLFNSLIKNLDKQFREMDREIGKEAKKPGIKKGSISISISSSGDNPPEIRVQSFGNIPEFKQHEQQIKREIKEAPPKNLSQKYQKKFSSLPREEPSTNLRRLTNKVVYEINLPEVKSINDISIIKLENSIEIKAVAKDKAYFKLIPINLPISNYKFSKGKLVLELEANN